MRRSNLLVLLGVAFFVVGGVIVYLLTNGDDGGSSGTVPPVAVVVGTQDITAGALADDLIDAGKLKVLQIPAGEILPGAVQTLNQLKGGTFVQGFAKDQQITSTGLQLQTQTFDIPKGYEAVAVQIDSVAGGARYVGPGDRINVYGLISHQQGGAPTPRAELLLTNVEVLDVDLTLPARRGQVINDANATTPRDVGATVTYLLAVKTNDAEKIIYTTQFEDLYITLTPDKAPPAGPTGGRDSTNILSEEPNAAFGG